MTGCMMIDPIGVDLDTACFEGAVKLLNCLEAQVAATVGGPVCRACLYPGVAVPMDVCHADTGCGSGSGHGMAAVRVASVQLLVQQVGTRCSFTAAQMAVTYEMSVYRCAHTIQRQAGVVTLPSCDELASDTAIVMDDAAAMRKALKCCYAVAPPGVAGGCPPMITNVSPWLPRGPIAGCMGGQMSFTVTLNDCGCAQ